MKSSTITCFLFGITIFIVSTNVFAQTKQEIIDKRETLGRHLCGTQAPSYAQNAKDTGNPKPRNKNAGFTQLPMRVHIVRQSNGTGGVSLDVVNHELSNLNYALYPEQIEYYIADVNYIDNTTWYDFDTSEETAMCNLNQVNDAVNVFWTNSLSNSAGTASYCGYAYFPANAVYSLRVLMDKDCAGGDFWDTFVHEFGHHLNLYHTHQGTENGNGHSMAEHVPRSGPQSNCSTDGDLLCDTNADPTGGVSSCVYNGGGTDIYGNPYNPDEDNIMSYYPDACGGTVFTPGQYGRIDVGLSARLGHNAYNIDGASPEAVNDPSGLTATESAGEIMLDWTDNSSIEAGYLVERSTDGVNFEPLPETGVGPNTTSITDDRNIQALTTYYYRVKASNDDPDDYSNTATVTTPDFISNNYTCATAYVLPGCGSYLSPGPDQGNGANNADADHSVWYEFTPPYSGTVDISACLGGTDTRLWVYTGTCGTLTQIAANDDECEMTPGSNLWASELTGVPVTKDVPIFLEWDDRWSGNGFVFSINLNATNACADAEHITSAGTYTVASIFCGNSATQSSADNAQIYRFTPPTTGTIDISSCSEGVNTRLWVYSGVCGSLTLVDSSDDDCGAGGGLGVVAAEATGISVTSGTDIFIEWDDRWSGNGFDFNISYQSSSCPPSYTLTGTQTTSMDFETNGTIISDQTINAGLTVDYDAGSEITLNPGFETTISAIFSAFIDGCGGSE